MEMKPAFITRFNDKFFSEFITFSSAVDVKEISAPLRYLNIDCFGYHRFYRDGSQTRLNNRPDYIEYYFKHKLFLNSYFGVGKHPDGVIVGDWLNNRLAHIYEVQRQFNMSPPLTVIQNYDAYWECFHFGLPWPTYSSSYVLLHYLDYLQHFITYFKNHARKLIQQAHDERFKLVASYPKDKEDIQPIPLHQLDRFLTQTPIKRWYLNPDLDDVYFTCKEVDILDLLSKGKNVLSVAKQLNCTKKTMEWHIRKIKQKFQCKTLFELGYKLHHDNPLICHSKSTKNQRS